MNGAVEAAPDETAIGVMRLDGGVCGPLGFLTALLGICVSPSGLRPTRAERDGMEGAGRWVGCLSLGS